jgi:hypothetical protein
MGSMGSMDGMGSVSWWADVHCTLRICKRSRPKVGGSLETVVSTSASTLPARDWVRAPVPCRRTGGLVA